MAEGDVVLHVPLHKEFRFIHEPLPVGDASIPVLGHDELVASLRERLTYSHGGAFLVTGFRGVGKTTLVMRALAQAASEPTDGGLGSGSDHDTLLVVYLSIARKMESNQLLFAVVRRIFETLDDRGLFPQLPPDVRESLLLAYTRTSLSFTQTQSEGSERGGTMGMGAQEGLLASVAPTLSLAGKRMSTRTTEASFLAYSETDVEHDLIRIIQLLSGRHGRPAARGRLRRRRPRLRVHPVIVLDEVDKLTDNAEDAITDLERLLGSFKSVLTTRGAHFILVAGPDLHDRALTDVDRGNGLYESVFAWRMYVPCLWAAPEILVQELAERGRTERGLPPLPSSSTGSELNPTLDLSGPEGEPTRLALLIAYLRFKSRGVPRRLLQEFNSLVVWDSSGNPALRVGEEAWQRILFYSHLDGIVSGTAPTGTTDILAPVPIDNDRWRLGGYHVADWALRSRGRVFAAADVTSDGQLDPLLRMDSPTVERLLRHLVRGGVLEVVNEADRPNATIYGNPAATGITYYKLADTYSRRLANFARHNESERADVGLPAPALRNWDTTFAIFRARQDAAPAWTPERGLEPPITRLSNRYEVRNLVGSGGMGAVYRGRDLRTGEDVAIKVLHHHLAEDYLMLVRFRREAEIGMQIRHPNISRTIAIVEAAPEWALIMELLDGPALSQVLEENGQLPPASVVQMGRCLGEALLHLHSLNLCRIDLKPSNIIAHPIRGPVVVDLGIARWTGVDENDRDTAVGSMVGTPAYMAPEQLRSATEADIRSDLYALGVVLYQCITGHPPHTGANDVEVIFSILREPISFDDLTGSEELRGVVVTCLAHDPADRYQDPADFLRALAATPEAGVSRNQQMW
ncbi:serine/threonine-protein kinase [Streptomyces atratus]|uniref:serine/threonine-protein kinase n=1 Tax=Streptomyces atratus TaxID=1893 RepID=UPI0013007FE6|nr:serine/threonine-protein kinase [Streptomyces atratus]